MSLEAEIARRAEQVEASAPASASAGEQPRSVSEAEEDAILARLDQQHRVPNQSDEEREDDFEPISPADDKPITWTKEDRLSGKDVVKRDQKGRFVRRQEAERQDDDEPGAPPAGREGVAADRRTERREEQEPTRTEERRVDPQDLRIALAALREDGYENADLREMTDDTIVRVGLRVDRRQRAEKERRDQHARVADHGSRFDPAPPPQERSAPQERAAAEPDRGWSVVESALAEGFADETLGKQAADALRSLIGSTHDAANGQQNGHGAMVQEALLDERARARLGKRFPQLSTDDGLWDRVNDEAELLWRARERRQPARSGREALRAIDSAFEDAARIVIREEPGDRQDRATAKRHRDSGQVTRPKISQPSKRSYQTREQLDDAWLDARMSGDAETMREIEALYATVAPGP